MFAVVSCDSLTSLYPRAAISTTQTLFTTVARVECDVGYTFHVNDFTNNTVDLHCDGNGNWDVMTSSYTFMSVPDACERMLL